MKKGQTSLEYLIILAVVVIVALAVVAALGGVPVLGGGSQEKISTAYWKSADVGITSARVTDDGQVQVQIKNNKDFTAKVTGLWVDGVDLLSATDKTLKVGGTTTITAGQGTLASNCTAGSEASFKVQVNYTDLDSGIGPYDFEGDERLVTTCQAA